MVKTLLSAVLVAAQVLSASASPLYVCLGRDGTVTVDFGTADCGCCRLDGSGSECCDDDHPAPHACSTDCQTHDGLEPEHAAEFDPCHCNHLQVAELRSATLDRADHDDAQPAATAEFAVLVSVGETLLAAPAALAPLAPAPARPLELRAGVLLRL
jgi:hypothetical protein